MEEQNTTTQETNKPDIKALGVLSIIGSSIYILLGLIFIFSIGWLMSMLGGGVAAMNAASGAYADSPEMADAMAQASSAMSGVKTIAYISLIVFIILAVVRLIGAVKMMKWKKSGYTLYMIANVIISLLFVYSLINTFNIWTLILLLLQIFFMVMFTSRKKHMA